MTDTTKATDRVLPCDARTLQRTIVAFADGTLDLLSAFEQCLAICGQLTGYRDAADTVGKAVWVSHSSPKPTSASSNPGFCSTS